MSHPPDGRSDPENPPNVPIAPSSGPTQSQQTNVRVGAPRPQGATGDTNDSSITSGSQAPTKQSTRICKKCGQSFTGQYVRALGGAFHLDCFKCRDCGITVASKFFPVDEDEEGGGQYLLCETDYFRRLDLICFNCGGALRGSYITALERKYHIEHFTCCVCPTVFGPQDSYYEHEAKVYCHYHYSTQFAAKCHGCQTAILKQFVEIFRNGQNQHWHPECYMIHKFWNVRLAPSEQLPQILPAEEGSSKDVNVVDDPSEQRRSIIREAEEKMEEKVFKIWSVLAAFEESSAACISDMLLHVSNGAYVEGVFVSERFIWHVEILFGSADNLDVQLNRASGKGLSYSREAKLLCKKIVAFFTLLSKTQETGVRKMGVTQELLSLVTGLAHYLKLLIRISLQGALRLEREYDNPVALSKFLEELGDLDSTKEMKQTLQMTQGMSANLADASSDLCPACGLTIEDECAKNGDRRWHLSCLICSADCQRDLRHHVQDAVLMEANQRILCKTCASHVQGVRDPFEHTTKLKQYVYLLRVALARLLLMLRQGGTLPHTSDDPNLVTYDSSSGHKPENLGPPLLRSDTRSKSYSGEQSEAYQNTVNDIKRLRSTRLDRALGSSARKARQSRIIEGPEADNLVDAPADGSTPAGPANRRESVFRIVEDKDPGGETTRELTFGDEKALTLDDIPRIVAAEQAREQRPNAFKHQRPGVAPANAMSPNQPRLVNGHQRDLSLENNKLKPTVQSAPSAARPKRYFSELSAIDYFIVRHIAVLSMEPLVEKYFNLEELLGLIETRKVNFWGRFGKAFGGKNNPDNSKKGTNKKKTGVFGIPLDVLAERDGADSSLGVGPGTLRIPGIIDDAVVAMRQMDMSVEGVFRKNGNIRKLKELAQKIDEGVENIDMIPEGPVQIAALLKKFLRDLPDPLLTFKLHRLFITSSKIKDEEKRRRVLHLTCCLLPKSHRDSMEILFSFLNWVASFSHVDDESGSKMDIHNLATVITPNILYPKTKDGKEGPGEETYFLAIEAINTLIEYNEQMCEVPEDLLSILNDSNLFANSADLTTKDILKRYGDIVNRPTPARTGTTVAGPSVEAPPKSRDGRGSAPIYHRVEADENPSNIAWQKESSVHVQGPPQASIPIHGNDGRDHGRGGHTRGNSESSNHDDPRGQTYTNGNLNNEHQQQPPYRNSQWTRPGPSSNNHQQPPVGVSGAI